MERDSQDAAPTSRHKRKGSGYGARHTLRIIPDEVWEALGIETRSPAAREAEDALNAREENERILEIHESKAPPESCPDIPHVHECPGPATPRNDNNADGVYAAKKCEACGCTCRGVEVLVSAAVATEIVPFSTRQSLLRFLLNHKTEFGGPNYKLRHFGHTKIRLVTLSEILRMREILMKPYSNGDKRRRKGFIGKVIDQLVETGKESPFPIAEVVNAEVEQEESTP